MKKNPLYFFLFIVLFSCEIKLNEIEAPTNVIPRDSMVLILEELMVIEQHIQVKYPQIDQFKSVAEKSGDEVFKKYHTSFKRFDKSLDYYASHQDEMESMNIEILERLSKKLNKL